ncbi:hypothetical protein N431DRAFT_469836 [Stipitochalara longipes BDJ]|nr:hypothetical protein N431DRAFT_469836 [Stipitochalara longipes BDJ]
MAQAWKITERVVWALIASTAYSLAAPQATTTTISSDSNMTSSTIAPSSTTFSPTFALQDSADRCWASWYSHSSAIASAFDDYSYTTLGTFSTYVDTSCCYPISNTVPMTTLCDGFPRAVGFPTTVYNITSTKTYYNYTQVSLISSSITNIAPTCTLDYNAPDCTRLWSSWDYTYTSLKSGKDRASELYEDYARPPCTSPLWPCPTSIAKCSIDADYVTMYYWPVTTASGGDFCAHNGSILTPTPTDPGGHPNTIVSGSMTFTSPSVYIVANSAYAWYATKERGYTTWGQSCGAVDRHFTYAVDPASMSTINPHTPEVLYPLDYQDLNTIRQEAYQRECGRRYGCSFFSSIVSDFTPYVKMPLGVNTVESEWKGCSGLGQFLPELIRLGETVGTSPAGALLDAQLNGKLSGPASNIHAKSTQTIGHIPGNTPTGDYPRKEFVEELRVIILDEIAPADEGTL